MSEKAEIEVEFPNQKSSSQSADPFAGGRSYGNAAAAREENRTPSTSKPKANLVVRACRAIGGWFMKMGRAVFSKKFWMDVVAATLAEAFRDAFNGLGYSIGMRMVKSALGKGDVHFQDKQGVVNTSGHRTSDSGQAFAQSSASSSWSQRGSRSYGSVQDDIMAYPANGRPYTQQKFNN